MPAHPLRRTRIFGAIALTTTSLFLANSYAPATADSVTGSAFSWGLNNQGQLGNGTTTNTNVPGAVDMSGALSGKTITEIAAGDDAACALTTDGQVFCWGDGTAGQLGNGGNTDSLVPTPIDTSGVLAGKTVIDISAMTLSMCALTSDGLIACWGDNLFGQLGNNNYGTDQRSPVLFANLGAIAGRTPTALSAGGFATMCAILDNGSAACWGAGVFGQMGNGTNAIENPTPIAVDMTGVLSGKRIASMSIGSYHVCALTTDRTLSCWGRNSQGQLGNGNTTDQSVPALVTTTGALAGLTASAITAGAESSCAIASAQVFCWGDGAEGVLGAGNLSDALLPQAIDTSGVMAGQRATLVAINGLTGSAHTCAVTETNVMACWGLGSLGQLGDGLSANSDVPVRVNQDGALRGLTITSIDGDMGSTFVVAGAGTASTSVPRYEFTYWLADGRECGAISPAIVLRDSAVTLPDADADCRTPGATLLGWSIPWSDRVFPPGAVVSVSGSQQFTAVLREPGVDVIYDANVGANEACLLNEVEVPAASRTATTWFPRESIGQATVATTAPCTPSGHRLTGWVWRASEPVVLAPGAATPTAWNVSGNAPINQVVLFAQWGVSSGDRQLTQ